MRQLLFLAGLIFAAGSAARPAELRFAIAGDPKTFDPLQVAESHSETIRYLTAGVLIRINRTNGKAEPELAESWTLSPDGKSISLRLRTGLQFSDGSSLNAADFVADGQVARRRGADFRVACGRAESISGRRCFFGIQRAPQSPHHVGGIEGTAVGELQAGTKPQ